MRVLFMGTPDFAAVCLDALVKSGFEVIGAVTKPDSKQGRGMKVVFSDVKVYAQEAGIPVFQPETLKDGAFLPVLEELKPDVIAVVAYGKILPSYILQFPKYGCVNVHGSVLPAYRGAAPIQRTVLDGCATGGVTTMLMDEGMDTGDILLSETLPVGENMTAGELFDALAPVGGALLVKTLHALADGSVTPRKQSGEATYAAKITESECLVDFTKEAKTVHNQIRGLSPFPGAYAYLDGKTVKLYGSSVYAQTGKEADCGTVIAADKRGVTIQCGAGTVLVTRFKPEGKGLMTASDMINGRKIAVGTVFTNKP